MFPCGFRPSCCFFFLATWPLFTWPLLLVARVRDVSGPRLPSSIGVQVWFGLDFWTGCGPAVPVRVSDDAACAGRFATSHGREYDAPRSRVTASKIRPSRWSITRLTTYTPSQHESHNSQRHKLDIRLSIWPPTLMWGDQITQLN